MAHDLRRTYLSARLDQGADLSLASGFGDYWKLGMPCMLGSSS